MQTSKFPKNQNLPRSTATPFQDISDFVQIFVKQIIFIIFLQVLLQSLKRQNNKKQNCLMMTERVNQWPEFINLDQKNLYQQALQLKISSQNQSLKPNSLPIELRDQQERIQEVNEKKTCFSFPEQFTNLNKYIDLILSGKKSYTSKFFTSKSIFHFKNSIPLEPLYTTTRETLKSPSVNPIFKQGNGIENIIENILNKKSITRNIQAHYGKDEIGKKIMRKLVSVVDSHFRRSIKTKGITINNFNRQQVELCLIQFLQHSCDVKPKHLNETQIRIAKKLIYPLAFKRKERKTEQEDMRHQILKKATKRELITFFKTYIGRKVFWDAFNTVLKRVGQSKDIKDSYKYLTYAQKIEKEICHQDTSQIS